MPSPWQKTVSILTSEHLQDILNSCCGFTSVQYELKKTTWQIRPPVHLKVYWCVLQFLTGSRVQFNIISTAERIRSITFWRSKKSGSGKWEQRETVGQKAFESVSILFIEMQACLSFWAGHYVTIIDFFVCLFVCLHIHPPFIVSSTVFSPHTVKLVV